MQEQNRVMDMFRNHLHLPVTCVDHSKAMLARLKGLSDPEEKRKAIGAEFIEVFKNFRDEMERATGKTPKFLVQASVCNESSVEASYVRAMRRACLL